MFALPREWVDGEAALGKHGNGPAAEAIGMFVFFFLFVIKFIIQPRRLVCVIDWWRVFPSIPWCLYIDVPPPFFSPQFHSKTTTDNLSNVLHRGG